MSNSFKKIVTGFSTIALAMSMIFVAAPVADAATAGGVYKTTDGTVWFVTDSMQKRPFTSAGAFLSYGFLSFSQVMEADASVTGLPQGSFIAPQDGRIFCATETKGTDVSGECALITGGKKAAFTSATVFAQQGFSFSRAFYGDSSFLEKTSNIDNGSAQHRPGTLINNGGTVQLVVVGGLWGVPSMDVFNSWGWSFADVVPANSADVLLSQVGIIPARMAGQLVPTGNTTPNPGPGADDCALSGNAGAITVNTSSLYTSEEVGEGENDQGVLAFEVEADNDSDVAVTSVKVELLHDVAAGGSDDIADYIDEVKIWYGDVEVGSADAADFSETGDVYTKNISLSCAEITADETGEFSVSISAVNALDSTDLLDANNDWDVDVLSVRFEDGDGVTTTTDTDTTPALDQTFEFVDFATANDVELNVSLTDDMDDVNESHNIVVDEDNTTDNEEILAFDLEASGDSDIWVDEIPVLITSTDTDVDGAGADTAALSTVISKADLYKGSTLVDSKSVIGAGLSQTITFDNLDITINAGDTEQFTVKVKILSVTGHYAEGVTLKAEITATQTDAIDAEDEEGDAVVDADATGTALGEFHSLFSDGISVQVDPGSVTVTPTDAAGGDVVEFEWNVTITNIGDDTVFITRDASNIVEVNQVDEVDFVYAITETGTAAITASATIADSGATEVTGLDGGYYSLAPGETETFTVHVAGTNGVGSGQVRAALTAIEWTTVDVMTVNPVDANISSYTAGLSDDSMTVYKFVN